MKNAYKVRVRHTYDTVHTVYAHNVDDIYELVWKLGKGKKEQQTTQVVKIEELRPPAATPRHIKLKKKIPLTLAEPGTVFQYMPDSNSYLFETIDPKTRLLKQLNAPAWLYEKYPDHFDVLSVH